MMAGACNPLPKGTKDHSEKKDPQGEADHLDLQEDQDHRDHGDFLDHHVPDLLVRQPREENLAISDILDCAEDQD
ncbi:hypothetical protein QZH41_003561, partial [Actinostola sp. cb2023]